MSATTTEPRGHSILSAPEYDYGKAPHDYGTGRVGGCGHRLSRYNAGPNCNSCGQPEDTSQRKTYRRRSEGHTVVCGDCGAEFTAISAKAKYCSAACRLRAFNERKRVPRKRGKSRSAGGSAATTAAEAPRRVTCEEVEMAARQRHQSKGLDEAVRAFVFIQPLGAYFTARQCALKIGCGESTARRRLTRLVESGLLSSSTAHGYRRQRGYEPATSEDAPAAHTGAAPDPTPEHPADPAAPDPDSPQESPDAGESIGHGGLVEGPPPFAGVGPVSVKVEVDTQRFTRAIDRVTGSDELTILRRIEDLDDEARERVLTFAVAKWFMPPTDKES